MAKIVFITQRDHTSQKIPKFGEASDFVTDSFWKKKLEDFSAKKFPNGVYISKGCLISSSKGCEFNYAYESKTPEEIAIELPILAREKLHIYSANEIESAKLVPTDDIVSWSNVVNKSKKEFLIREFIASAKNEYRLTKQISERLFAYLMINIANRVIGNDHIIIKDSKIAEITGLTFDHGKYELVLSSSKKSLSK